VDSALAALAARDGRSSLALARAERTVARSAEREPERQGRLRKTAQTLARLQERLAQLDLARSEDREVSTQSPNVREPAGWMGVTHSGPVMLTSRNGTLLLTHHGYPLVESVEPGSPAEAAGIETGDTIVAYNGRDLRNATLSLSSLLTPGKRVVVKVRRDGRTKSIPVTIARRPRREEGMWTTAEPLPPMAVMPPMAPMPPTPPMPPTHERAPRPPRTEVTGVREPGRVAPPAPRTPPAPRATSDFVIRWEANAVAGAEVVAMNDDLREAFGGRHGLLVLGVVDGSPAYEAGLRGGDVIVRAGRDPVATPAALRSALRAVKKGRALELDVVRKGKERAVELRWSAIDGRHPR
jgi:serine protease Do